MLEVSVTFVAANNSMRVHEVTLDLDSKGLAALQKAIRETPVGSWSCVDPKKVKVGVPTLFVRRRFDPPSRRS